MLSTIARVIACFQPGRLQNSRFKHRRANQRSARELIACAFMDRRTGITRATSGSRKRRNYIFRRPHTWATLLNPRAAEMEITARFTGSMYFGTRPKGLAHEGRGAVLRLCSDGWRRQSSHNASSEKEFGKKIWAPSPGLN
jgi:hypothetical protein